MPDCEINLVSYGGWPNCYRLTNGVIELVVTTDVGPRIIRCGFVNGPNMFVEVADQLGGSGEPHWMMRGGHRLWIAPEIVPDTYALDNAPVSPSFDANGMTVVQAIEPETGLQKQITIAFLASAEIQLTHTITNKGSRLRRIAPWALSQMSPGGIAITRFPPRGPHSDHLQPTHPLVMWAYTDFRDPRWCFTNRYLILKQDSSTAEPQKTGLFNRETFAAYFLGSNLFTKTYQADPTALHPDFHCSCELFTNGDFLELETLGPLSDLQPGQSVSHIETWNLYRNVSLPAITDAAIDEFLSRLS